MRIVYLGLNKIGKRIYDWLLEQGEEVLCLLTSSEQLRLIPELKPDLIISGGFRSIIPKNILDIPKKGCINFHKALLPVNRGANPNVWTILKNTPAGVTIHLMDHGIDSGPILKQREVRFSPADTAGSLYTKLEEAQFDLFRDFWPEFKGGAIQPVKQNAQGTIHKKSDFKNLWQIDLDRTYRAEDFITLLRSLTFPPFKNAYFEKQGKRYYLEIRIHPEQERKENPSVWLPDYHTKD